MENKKQYQLKISAIIIMFVLAVIITSFSGCMPKKSGAVTEGNITYSNKDYSYHPSKNNIDYDNDKNVIYFNNLLVVYTFTKMDKSTADSLAGTIGGTVVGKLSGCINALQISVKESTLEELNEMSKTLMKDENVLFASYDYPIHFSESTVSSDPWSDDPNMPETDIGNENNPGGNDWWAEAIGAYTAWDNVKNTHPVKVGIIDTGVDKNHEDLKGRIEFLSDYKENSESEHGTHVAGVIGAIGDNKKGIRGIVDNAKLVCVDWNPTTNDETSDDYVSYLSTGEHLEIIKSLIENGVKVINNSWGLFVYSEESFMQSLYEDDEDTWSFLQYFAEKGDNAYESYLRYMDNMAKRTGTDCTLALTGLLLNGKEDFIIVQSAGNGYDNGLEGIDAERSGHFCAVTNDVYTSLDEEKVNKLSELGINYSRIKDHILIVGAVENKRIGRNYQMTYFSNFGPSVDICAPGQDVFSTVTGDRYMLFNGTSMSAPLVAGSVALAWSINQDYTASQIKNIIVNGSNLRAVGVGADSGNEYPMLNIGGIFSSQNSDDLFGNYIVNELRVIDASEFSFSQRDGNGVFSAAIADFDGNGVDEMITAMLYEDDVLLDLYCIENGNVVKKDTMEKFEIAPIGSGQTSLCALFEDGVLKLHYSKSASGGSCIIDDGFSYQIKKNKFVLCKDYHLFEFYREEKYIYEEKVSGKKFNGKEEFYNTAKNSGLDVKGHWHAANFLSEIDSAMQEELSGNHIFTLINGNNFSEEGPYGFIFDNSKLKKYLPFINNYNTPEYASAQNVDLQQVLVANDWENDIHGHNEYSFEKNGTSVKVTAESMCNLGCLLEEDAFVVTLESGQTKKLKYVNKNYYIDWSRDKDFYKKVYPDLGDDEWFFYETSYDSDKLDSSNAMYLRAKK